MHTKNKIIFNSLYNDRETETTESDKLLVSLITHNNWLSEIVFGIFQRK